MDYELPKSTTVGVKIDGALRQRVRVAVQRIQRSPHWLMKQAICTYLEKIEGDEIPPHVGWPRVATSLLRDSPSETAGGSVHPFLEFAQNVQPQSVLRAAITAAYRRPEPECVPFLLGQARLPANLAGDVQAMAGKLVETLRTKSKGGGVEGLIHEFSQC